MPEQITAEAEYTDTFGGEANYSWVKRVKVTANTELGLVRRAKEALGLSGVRCKREEIGESIVLRPYRSCTVVFINPI